MTNLALFSRLGNWTYHSSSFFDRQIDDEIDFHLACRTEELMTLGMTPEQAQAEANRQFGARDKIRQQCQVIDYGYNLWLTVGVSIVFLAMLIVIGWMGSRLNSVNQQNQRIQAQLLALQPVRKEQKGLMGTVVDVKGKAIADAKVLLIYKSWPNNQYQQEAFNTTTDDQGAFSFAEGNVLKDQEAFLVSVVKDGYAFESRYLVKKAGKAVNPFKFQLAPAVPKVLILQAEGRPLANVTVSLSARKEAKKDEHLIYFDSSAEVSFETDQDGRVSLNHFAIADAVKLTVDAGADPIEITCSIDKNPEQTVEVKKSESSVASSEETPSISARPEWTPSPLPVAAARIESIRQHAIPFHLSTRENVESGISADLPRLKNLIGEARIVQLGEQSHGDGACFEAKVRLIEFLHREMGFEVLAFESGLYDCSRANDAIAAGISPTTAAEMGVFPIWSACNELVPLWNYLAETAKSTRPLRLAGFDCQFTGMASYDFLVSDLKAISTKYQIPGVADDSSETWQTFFEQLQFMISGKTLADSKAWLTSLDLLLASLENAKVSDEAGEQELAFWRQQLRSLKSYVTYTHSAVSEADPGTVFIQSINARDAQMANNLIWLANQRYAKRKIIVWAASMHIMRNAPGIEVPDGSVDYTKIVNMGQHVHQKLGKEVFTIGFTAAEGQAGICFGGRFPISAAPRGTLEDICDQAGLVSAIIPLCNLSNETKWLREKIFSRPLGYGWMNANWSDHFDAMIFQKTMTPATAIQSNEQE